MYSMSSPGGIQASVMLLGDTAILSGSFPIPACVPNHRHVDEISISRQPCFPVYCHFFKRLAHLLRYRYFILPIFYTTDILNLPGSELLRITGRRLAPIFSPASNVSQTRNSMLPRTIFETNYSSWILVPTAMRIFQRFSILKYEIWFFYWLEG